MRPFLQHKLVQKVLQDLEQVNLAKIEDDSQLKDG